MIKGIIHNCVYAIGNENNFYNKEYYTRIQIFHPVSAYPLEKKSIFQSNLR